MASRKRWLESQGKKAAQQESWQTEWHDIKYQGVMAKALPCSERTFKTTLPQQGSPSSRDEESQCVAVEDRRRMRVAFEETARGILRYLEDSEDLEVSVTEVQEQMGMSEDAGVSFKQVARRQGQETRTAFVSSFVARRRRCLQCQIGQM